MGLIILLAIGGVLGWLLSIIVVEQNHEMIGTNIAAGALGAVALGLLIGKESPLEAIVPLTIVFAVLGALKGVALVNIVSRVLIRS